MSGTYNGPNIVLPYVMPANVPDALVPIIKPIYLALQNIVQAFINYCGVAPRTAGQILSSNADPSAILANNTHRFYLQAIENINQGSAINLFASAGSLFVQNANATDNTKQCDGFCSQPNGIVAGGIGEVILSDGVNSYLTGLVTGSRYYLSTTSGNYTTIPPTASGNLQQSLGIAISSTVLRFWTGNQIQH